MPAKPTSAFLNPAAVLPGEADVLANVLTDLSDHDAKLVYADWLEDRDDPRGPLLRKFITAYRAGKELPDVTSAPEPWRDVIGLTLVRRLRDTDLAPHSDALLALARPSVAYNAVKTAEESLPVGGSKFGGRPDLPGNLDWPEYEGEPLSFFGQFNLDELQTSPIARELPPAGVLSVFCVSLGEGDDNFPNGSWRLFYFPQPSDLVRRANFSARFAPCRLEYSETLTLPKWDSPWKAELAVIGITGYGESYGNLYYDLVPGDHLLGYPYLIQSDVLGEKSMRHLLTINSNDAAGWELADGGAFYFILPDADLKAARFDAVRLFFDCG
jgi:uncharacterized protein (TIGR02996 family)